MILMIYRFIGRFGVQYRLISGPTYVNHGGEAHAQSMKVKPARMIALCRRIEGKEGEGEEEDLEEEEERRKQERNQDTEEIAEYTSQSMRIQYSL